MVVDQLGVELKMNNVSIKLCTTEQNTYTIRYFDLKCNLEITYLIMNEDSLLN